MIKNLIKSRVFLSLLVLIIVWTISFIITRLWHINENIFKDLFTSAGGGLGCAIAFYFILPKINPSLKK